MRKFKKMLALVLAFAMAISSMIFPVQTFAASEIRVTVDGEVIRFADQAPVSIGGRTLVPLRAVFEHIGFTVAWDSPYARLTRGNDFVEIRVGSAAFIANGQTHTLDVPAQSIGGRTMLPIRAVLESVGYDVRWDSVANTVVVTSRGVGLLGGLGSAANDEENDFDTTLMPDDIPYIRVLSGIPSGWTHLGFVDIEYIAVASTGANISTVVATINGRITRYLYVRGRRGELGQARFPLSVGLNHIEITVRDSLERESTYVVENTPYRQGTVFSPPSAPENLVPLNQNAYLVNNRLRLTTIWSYDDIYYEVVEAITSKGGIVIGYTRSPGGSYTIEVPPNTREGLDALGASFIETFPHLFRHASLVLRDRFPPGDFADNALSTGNDENIQGGDADSEQESFHGILYTIPEIDSTATQIRAYSRPLWGLTDTRFPCAWAAFDNQNNTPRQNVRVGIIDQAVNPNHPALMLGDVVDTNFSQPLLNPQSHGNMVMSIIGALHNNYIPYDDKGFVGGINIARENLFAFDTLHGYRIEGLTWNVEENEVNVLNISMHLNYDERDAFHYEMERLLRLDYDFIIVQSAGNDYVNTNYSQSNRIAYGASDELRNRIITVGNVGPGYPYYEVDPFDTLHRIRIAHDSNFGDLVDVVAPGNGTWSAVAGYPWFNFGGGTSSSAPYVSALAAMIWDEHPNLQGCQVRDIIIQSALEHGEVIRDNRAIFAHRDQFRGTSYVERYYNREMHMINALAAMELAEVSRYDLRVNLFLAASRDNPPRFMVSENGENWRELTRLSGAPATHRDTVTGLYFNMSNIPASSFHGERNIYISENRTQWFPFSYFVWDSWEHVWENVLGMDFVGRAYSNLFSVRTGANEPWQIRNFNLTPEISPPGRGVHALIEAFGMAIWTVEGGHTPGLAGRQIIYSRDGFNWHFGNTPTPSGDWHGLAYNGRVAVAVDTRTPSGGGAGSAGRRAMISNDGINWRRVNTPEADWTSVNWISGVRTP